MSELYFGGPQDDGRSAYFETIYYGNSDHQQIDVYRPAQGPIHGISIVIHGGFWRSNFSRSLMEDLCLLLVERGWIACNVEYRRTGTGGEWPVAVHDVRSAIDRAITEVKKIQDGLSVVSVGHSAGGHLALLAADLVDAVVALAPITDMARCELEELGEGAAREFMQSSFVEKPLQYRAASPIHATPANSRILVVHGDRDERVPVEHSRAYVSAADLSSSVDYMEAPGVQHRSLIDPNEMDWQSIVDWIEKVAENA